PNSNKITHHFMPRPSGHARRACCLRPSASGSGSPQRGVRNDVAGLVQRFPNQKFQHEFFLSDLCIKSVRAERSAEKSKRAFDSGLRPTLRPNGTFEASESAIS